MAGPGEALVDVAYGGVCGSDLHYWREGAVGTSVLRAPMILGHEVVGRVAVAAADGSGPAVGQAVAVHPARSCGHCQWCLAGASNLCPETRYLGSAAQFPHTDGGFADRIAVPAGRLIPLPDSLALRRAALAEPAGIAYHALDRAEAVGASLAGAHVLVVGGGPIGLLVAAVARYRGAASVTVADVQERPLAVARELGVSAVHARDLVDAGEAAGGQADPGHPASAGDPTSRGDDSADDPTGMGDDSADDPRGMGNDSDGANDAVGATAMAPTPSYQPSLDLDLDTKNHASHSSPASPSSPTGHSPAHTNSGIPAPPDIVIESSGTVPGLGSAIRAARPGGTVVLLGQVPAGDISVPASLCITRELTLTGSLRLIEIERAVAFLADPRAVVDPIVSDIFPVDQAIDAFSMAADPARSSKVLLDFSEEAR